MASFQTKLGCRSQLICLYFKIFVFEIILRTYLYPVNTLRVLSIDMAAVTCSLITSTKKAAYRAAPSHFMYSTSVLNIDAGTPVFP